MLKYIAKRLVYLVLTLLIIVTVTFFLKICFKQSIIWTLMM